MATLNKVMLIGRLTTEPEKRVFESGTSVVKFRFAVGRSKKNDSGGWDKDPNQLYIDCEAFARPDSKRNLVDLITKFSHKGDPMYLEGRLVFEEWEDKNGGGKRSKHKIIIDSLEFLGARNNDGGGGSGDEGGDYESGSSGGGRSSGGGGRSYGSGGGGNGGGSRQTNSGGKSGGGSPPPNNNNSGDDGGSGGDGDPIPF